MSQILIRPLNSGDGPAAAHVFHDAVHRGTADFYTPLQRQAWAGRTPNPAAWSSRFKDMHGFAALADGRLIGFMTIDATGYIDLAFVQPEWTGGGVGKRLYNAVAEWAHFHQVQTLTTQASKMAKPFFEGRGWRVDGEQVVVRRGVKIPNYRMSRSL